MCNLPELVYFGLNAVARRLVHSRDLQEEQNLPVWPCADRGQPASKVVSVSSSTMCALPSKSLPVTIVNWYWEHTTGGDASNDEDLASECSSGFSAGW